MRLSIDAPRDAQSVTPDWQQVTTRAIEGVTAIEVKHVLTGSGSLVELLRPEWLGRPSATAHVFLRTLDADAISAWHMHRTTTDRLFCVGGRALIVLYDAREGSATHGTVAEYHVGRERPTLIVVPPGVFHGVKALGTESATLINMTDEPYSYTEPDHWRLPSDAREIPYRFSR